MSEQGELEFLTHRREGAQIAGGGLHLLRPELVLAVRRGILRLLLAQFDEGDRTTPPADGPASLAIWSSKSTAAEE